MERLPERRKQQKAIWSKRRCERKAGKGGVAQQRGKHTHAHTDRHLHFVSRAGRVSAPSFKLRKGTAETEDSWDATRQGFLARAMAAGGGGGNMGHGNNQCRGAAAVVSCRGRG